MVYEIFVEDSRNEKYDESPCERRLEFLHSRLVNVAHDPVPHKEVPLFEKPNEIWAVPPVLNQPNNIMDFRSNSRGNLTS
jgi:hypothetical protein